MLGSGLLTGPTGQGWVPGRGTRYQVGYLSDIGSAACDASSTVGLLASSQRALLLCSSRCATGGYWRARDVRPGTLTAQGQTMTHNYLMEKALGHHEQGTATAQLLEG